MTTPPYPPGPYGQPNQDPWGQQSGGGYGQYGQQRPQGQPQQPQYGDPWANNEQTEKFGPAQPFGQAPQYGQGQYGQYGQTQYGGGFPPPEPPKKTGMIVAIVAIAVLVVAGAGVGIYFATKGDDGKNTAGGTTTTTTTTGTSGTTTSDETTTTDEETTTAESGGAASDAQPGDCIKVNVASSTNADVEAVDCSTDEAIYKVATREEDSTVDCPNENYVQYTEDGQLSLCMELNVHEGECLEVTDNEDKRADCATPSATHRVVGVLDGVDDEKQCADESTDIITYPQPPLTICLVSPAS